MSIAERLHALRLEAGLSVFALARQAGIAGNTVHRAEAGTPSSPEKLILLDRFFGGRLLQGTPPPPLPQRGYAGGYHTNGEDYTGRCTALLSDGTVCDSPCHKRTDGLADVCVACWAFSTIPESARTNARQADAAERQREYRDRWERKKAARAEAMR